MASSTGSEIESNLIHVLSWTLEHLESLCKEVVTEGEAVWPTLEQLVASGQLGKDILRILAILKPVLTYAQTAFPEYSGLITWAVNILTDIANFDTVNIPCVCAGCQGL